MHIYIVMESSLKITLLVPLNFVVNIQVASPANWQIELVKVALFVSVQIGTTKTCKYRNHWESFGRKNVHIFSMHLLS